VTDAALYFIFIKMVILYISMKFLVMDAFILFASTHGKYCTNLTAAFPNQKCAYTLSGYNLKAASDQMYLNII
jgi:hypothetical protein